MIKTLPDPLPSKDGLDDHGAAEQVADLQTDDRHQRDERVPKRVAQDDRASRELPSLARSPRTPHAALRACWNEQGGRSDRRRPPRAPAPAARASAAPTLPVAGNQRRLTEKMRMRTSATQKTGMATPSNEMTMLAASIQVRWRTAETIPSGTPIRSATAIALPVSRSVCGSAVSACSVTSRLEKSDRPRSPRTAASKKSRYCAGQGWSSPSCCSSRARSVRRGAKLAEHHLGRVARREVHQGEDDEGHADDDHHALD